MQTSLNVLKPGLFATIQDHGRRGCLKSGIPHGGALDLVSLQLANLLVGNDPHEGALEILYAGPDLEVCGGPVRVACVAAAARLEVKATHADAWVGIATGESRTLPPGALLRCRTLPGCLPAYLAFGGGFDVPLTFGSRSTYVRGRLGGADGRALRPDDVLFVRAAAAAAGERRCECPGLVDRPLRVVLGPQADYFSSAAIDAFFGQQYAVTEADRMALRLEGDQIDHARGFNIVSDATTPGAIQIAGDGQPIVLSADCQTTGGYPKIGVVISADLPALGRMGRGTRVRFAPISLAEAVEARREMRAAATRMTASVRSAAPAALGDVLLIENLISGVFDAAEPAFV